MGINIPASSSLGSISCPFFSFFFFFSANMNLTFFAGILLAVTMATARRASLGEKTMQAAGVADEPVEAMREAARSASLVEKILGAAAADKANRAARGYVLESNTCKTRGKLCKNNDECCFRNCQCYNFTMRKNAKICLTRHWKKGVDFAGC